MNIKIYFWIGLVMLCAVTISSCKKLVEIGEPTNTLTAEKAYSNEKQAESVLLGVYSALIHGPTQTTTQGPHTGYTNFFAGGLTTMAGSLSAVEMINTFNNQPIARYHSTATSNYWNSAYQSIYFANSFIEGITQFGGASIRVEVRERMIGEAKVIRAFTHLMLSQFYGDVPIINTIDFNKTRHLPRSPVADVYAQIVKDLKEAYDVLPGDFSVGGGERIRVNKWVAAGLLARTYTYMKDYVQAEKYASEVIAQTNLFSLPALDQVFLANSKETILQLKPTNAHVSFRNATPDAYVFQPNPRFTGAATYMFDQNLLNSFTSEDRRSTVWIDSTRQTSGSVNIPGVAWYPSKYKQGREGAVQNSVQREYYTVLRLAELHFIRAEAALYGQVGTLQVALDDLNLIRNRAGLANLSSSLSAEQLKTAYWEERKKELFVEWAHRWIDLRRSGLAEQELSKLQAYQPWPGDWILLYPIPVGEIEKNPNLKQNPMYDSIIDY